MTPGTDIVAKSSGEIDLRALARAYDRAQDVVRHEESFELAAPPLPLLVPRAASERGRPGALWLGIGALLLVTTTVAITVTVVTLRRQPESAPVATPPRAPLPLAGASVTSSPAPAARAPMTAPAVAEAPIAAPAVAGHAPVAAPATAARQPRSIDADARPRDSAASAAGEQVASASEEAAAPAQPGASPEPATAPPAEVAPVPTPAPAPAAPAETAATAPANSCDELTCLVEPDAACCRRAGAAIARAETAAASPALPTALSRAEIETALRPLRGRLQSCADRHAFAGTATIKLRIAADGAVRDASVAGGTPELSACVRDLATQARFPATQDGVSVRYPLILK